MKHFFMLRIIWYPFVTIIECIWSSAIVIRISVTLLFGYYTMYDAGEDNKGCVIWICWISEEFRNIESFFLKFSTLLQIHTSLFKLTSLGNKIFHRGFADAHNTILRKTKNSFRKLKNQVLFVQCLNHIDIVMLKPKWLLFSWKLCLNSSGTSVIKCLIW